MADIGYIKLYRKIWENPIYCSDERFDRRSAWLYLLTHANYEEGSFLANGRMQRVQRGQIFTSVRHLASVWKWDKTTVSNFLTDIETEKMIQRTQTRTGTLITIVNFNKYQASGDSTSKNADTESDTKSDTKSDTGQTQNRTQLKNNNKNNTKKVRNNIREGQVIE